MALEDLESLEPLLPPDKPDVGAHPAACPVIGLGASAGGLEAFQAFLKALPVDLGYAALTVVDDKGAAGRVTALVRIVARASCVTDTDCADGFGCQNGACKKTAGSTCTTDTECASGFCTDGVCCQNRCNGTCEKCDTCGSTSGCS
mgnify:CR=1 FL=1